MIINTEEMVSRIQELEAMLAQLQKEKEELVNKNTALYKYCQRMDRKYNASVQRELSYREMLFVFNNRHATDLLKEYIGKEGLQIQYSGNYNFRSN